jgi:hypothetical protein
MLTGLAGDLLAATIDPAGHRGEPLVSFTHPNPWHLVLLLGVVATSCGGIRWAVRQRSEWGALLGGLMSLLLIATLALGGWAALRPAGDDAPVRSAAAARPIPFVIHDHAHGAANAVEGVAGFGEHVHGRPGPVTAAQRKVLDRQLAAAKAATARFRNVAAARAAGYIQVTQFIPGLGLHMVNLRIPNTTFDPARPQILLYEPAASGGMRLVGVAYQFRHTNDTPPAGFAGGADVWHYHTDLCFQAGGSVTIAASAAQCTAVGGIYFQKRTAWLLHAWIWKKNPAGVFTEVNSRVG